jgi:RNA polymerase sigma-70 factor (ECF subfamily)
LGYGSLLDADVAVSERAEMAPLRSDAGLDFMSADALVERMWEGDVEAFEVLYERYHLLVYGVALKISNDARVAEDVSQTVFLKLWRSYERYARGNLGGWLSRVTRNQTIDVVRRLEFAASATAWESTATETVLDDVCERLEASWGRQSIVRALEQLRSEERVAIELGFFNGLTHVEIARQISVPLGTVKTRIRSGLQRLRSILASEITGVVS